MLNPGIELKDDEEADQEAGQEADTVPAQSSDAPPPDSTTKSHAPVDPPKEVPNQ